MADNNRERAHSVPTVKHPLRLSWAASGIIVAALLLVTLLFFSTKKNVDRAQLRMEGYLTQKAELIVRSIEAGIRTMMRHKGEGHPLRTLIQESSRGDEIFFLRIVDRQGEILVMNGDDDKYPLSIPVIEEILRSRRPDIGQNVETGQFFFSRKFHLIPPKMRRPGRKQRIPRWVPEKFLKEDLIITVGLRTTSFDRARRQEVRSALLMGTILLMVGSAGFYFIYLYQGMRVAQRSLANMKLYTDNVIESIPAGLFTLDSENKIVSCNQNGESITGKSFSDLQGKGLESILPESPDMSMDLSEDIIDYGVALIGEKGREVHVKMSSSSLMDQDGARIGTVLILRDMSQLRDMELQLERSRRMAALGKMAAGIAHEIRNPLGTLRGFAQFFGKRADNDQESKRYAELMVSEVDRLNQNISGLLQFARPREPDKRWFSLGDLMAKTMSLMEGDFDAQGVKATFICPPDVELFADPDLLLQVFLNLLKNSIHATEEGGNIRFIASRKEERICISVSDSGSGMSEKERQRMFDPFFTTRKSGTGLGLTVSHQIVEQHNGSFEVLSQPQEGTTIEIRLPIS